MRKEKAKRVSLKLSIEELNLLGRLVGNHTLGGEQDNLFGKLCTLAKHEKIDWHEWGRGVRRIPGTTILYLAFASCILCSRHTWAY